MPRKVTFLTLDEVLALHALQLEEWGGGDGVRDFGLLESAVASPMATFGGEYLHGSLAEKAAAYLFHLAQNHPFVDGNKRVALHACLTFLALNGVVLSASPEDLLELVLRVAQGKATKAEIAVFLEKWGRKPARPRRGK